ncbi:MAG: ABC transporter ATP-binding protein/permease [Bacteroidia bacterium]|nr:ABC transporter ATP-binding protein/permease [Bacteroidia bacterium]
MYSLKSINVYLLKYKWRLLLGALFVVLSTLFSIYQGVIVRNATNEIVSLIANHTSVNTSQFIIFGITLFALALTSGFFLFLMRQTIIVMSRHIEFDQKNELYAHYQTLDASFYKNNSTGDLMNRISEDIGKVRMYTGPAIMYLINTFATVLIVLVFMLKINWQLTLLVFAPLPLLSFVIYKVSDLINKRSTIVQQGLSKLTSHAQETFSAIRVIKAYAREKHYVSELETLNTDFKKQNLRLAIVEAFFQPVLVLMIGVSVIATVWFGGHLVIDKTIEPGNITEFILYVYKLTWPFASLGWVTSLIQRASASQTRINEFLNTKSTIVNTPEIKQKIEGDIEFINVGFIYADSKIEALKNLNLKIEKGKTIGIKGQIGAGKSTLVNLLTRMYDSTSGEIYIDNKPIKKYDLFELRKSIGYVPQEVFLFSDTIRNNIAFSSNHTYSESEIIQAAKDAGVYENIMAFPEGFNTVVGERGVTLSGGQKQRISIARAIISRPQILIFDDCLSAVDVETEELILNNLKSIMKDKTSIIISHRDSALRYADKVVEL